MVHTGEEQHSGEEKIGSLEDFKMLVNSELTDLINSELTESLV